MWVALLSMGAPTSFFLLCAGSALTFPLPTWKRTLPWLMIGWGLAWTLRAYQENQRLPERTSSNASWVLLRPTFLPTAQLMECKGAQAGIWTGVDVDGRHIKMWMKADVPDMQGMWQWALVILRPLEISDLNSPFDFQAYLRTQGVSAQGEVVRWGESLSRSWMAQRTARLGWAWRTHLATTFKGDETGLLLGIFGGDKKAVSPEIRQAFQHLGLAHLLAVSGYHVGLVACVFLVLLRAQNRWVKRGSFMGVFVSWCFVMACGSPVSGLRSWLMLTLVWGLMVRGKRPLAWEAFGIAGVLACLADVNLPLQLGTQLSFIATGSLLALAGHKRAGWIVPWRAQWATSLLTVPTFPIWPIWFYPMNLIAGVVMLALGVAVAGCLLKIPGMTRATLSALEAMTAMMIEWADLPASTASTHWLGGRIGLLFLIPLSLRWVVRFVHRDRRPLFWGALCFSCFALGMWRTYLQTHEGKLSWHHLPGYPGAWAVTDGYGWRSWMHGQGNDGPGHAPKRLSLEGPFDHWGADGLGAPPNQGQKKWIPPPMKVWIQKEKSNSTSHPVHDSELSSASANW